MVCCEVNPVTRIGIGGDNFPLLIIWFINCVVKNTLGLPAGLLRRRRPEMSDMAHLSIRCRFIFEM